MLAPSILGPCFDSMWRTDKRVNPRGNLELGFTHIHFHFLLFLDGLLVVGLLVYWLLLFVGLHSLLRPPGNRVAATCHGMPPVATRGGPFSWGHPH